MAAAAKFTHYYFSNAGEKDNTAASFRLKLAEPLELEGVWEAALLETHIPDTWQTLFEPIAFLAEAAILARGRVAEQDDSEDVRKLLSREKDGLEGQDKRPEDPEWAGGAFGKIVDELEKRKKGACEKLAAKRGPTADGADADTWHNCQAWFLKLTPQHFNSPHEIAIELSRQSDGELRNLEYDRKQIATVGGPERVSWVFSELSNRFSISTNLKHVRFSIMTGDATLKTLGLASYRFSPNERVYVAPAECKASFGNPGAFLLYWDAIEYSAVGDTAAPILAALDPFQTCVRLKQPTYHRLTKSYINEVEFSIRNSTSGELVDFHKRGQTVLVVEYRKVLG